MKSKAVNWKEETASSRRSPLQEQWMQIICGSSHLIHNSHHFSKSQHSSTHQGSPNIRPLINGIIEYRISWTGWLIMINQLWLIYSAIVPNWITLHSYLGLSFRFRCFWDPGPLYRFQIDLCRDFRLIHRVPAPTELVSTASTAQLHTAKHPHPSVGALHHCIVVVHLQIVQNGVSNPASQSSQID